MCLKEVVKFSSEWIPINKCLLHNCVSLYLKYLGDISQTGYIKPFLLMTSSPNINSYSDANTPQANQHHRVVNQIEEGLENKQMCTWVFLDIEQVFNRAWK